MRAALERRVAHLEQAQMRRLAFPNKGMSDREFARRIALVLDRADQGDPKCREVGIRVAKILQRAERVQRKE